MDRLQEIVDKRPALKALGSEECVCGQPKRRKQYFCRACWHRLPGDIRIALKFPYNLSTTEDLYELALADLKATGVVA
ncbi:MAG: hypothetical protein ABIK12_18340 [Pseudomonadota bacterium]